MKLHALHSAIICLPPTGANGFEGLIRDMLTEVTGERFGVIKSGDQPGADVLSTPGESLLTIAAEGKRYGDGTSLPVDALRLKLVSAASVMPQLDLWLLVTTRRIDPMDQRKLADLGETFGIDVIVFDWDEASAAPSPLAILAACAPAAVTSRLQMSEDVEADLDAIRKHPMFKTERDRLIAQLSSPAVGYAAAKRFLDDWNRAQLSDPDRARLAFDSHADLLAANAHRIRRRDVEAAIESWWADGNVPVVALLGEEGAGKTWAALDWWLNRSSADWPLTIVIPARDVHSENGPELLARRLHRITGIRSQDFWRKRLSRWIAEPGLEPAIVVLIDGLNQNWTFNRWSEVILSLSAGDWKGKARLVLTSRPDHWNHRLGELRDLTSRPSSVTVPLFCDEELDQILETYDLERKDFDDGVIELMRVPRLCHLAIKYHDELSASGDITRERLMYEDWRHRSHGATRMLSHEQFRSFTGGLAAGLRDDLDGHDISRKQLLDRLVEGSGRSPSEFEGVLSELIDGRWIEETGKAHRFRVHKERLPDVLGIALVELTRPATSEGEAEAIVRTSIEPYQGGDVSVAILRSAATFALVDGTVPVAGRRALLREWLAAQNFYNSDFQAFWRLIGLDIPTVLACVESIWFGEHLSGRADEVIVKAFANATRWNDVLKGLQEATKGWLSRLWLDPREGAVLGRVEQDDRARERMAATRERFAQWQASGIGSALGLTLELAEPDNQSWGAARTIELLSWQKRSSFIPSLLAWAITRAIMGPPFQEERVGWLLRWNEEDAAEAEREVLGVCGLLLSHDSEITAGAARLLLEALATPAAMRFLAERVPARVGPAAELSIGDAVELDGRTINWNVDEASRWPRCKDAPLEAAIGLNRFVWNSELDLDVDLVDRLKQLARSLTDDQLWSVAGNGNDDGGLSNGRLPLARWAPEERAEIERRRFDLARMRRPLIDVLSSGIDGVRRAAISFLKLAWRGAPEEKADATPEPLPQRLSRWLPASVLALPDDQLAGWRELARADRRKAVSVNEIHVGLQVASLVSRPAGVQVAVISELPDDAGLEPLLVKALVTPDAGVFAIVGKRLTEAASDEQRLKWLTYLINVRLKHMPENWAPLQALLGSASPQVRGRAMQAALYSGDPQLADTFEATGWTAAGLSDRIEIAVGSLLLTESTKAETDPDDIIARVHGEALGKLVDRFPDNSVYLDAFADFVERELDLLFTAKSMSFPRAILNSVGGWDHLARMRPERLRAALQPVFKGDPRARTHFMAEDFPLHAALRTYARIDPSLVADLVADELRLQMSSNFRSGDYHLLAIQLPGPEGDSARDVSLFEANDDEKLAQLSRTAQEHGREDWLLRRIREDLRADAAGLIARGIVLAGFLDDTEQARALWSGELADPPAAGWLARVHDIALLRFRKNQESRHWQRMFNDDPDDARAFSAHELVVASVDLRVFGRARRQELEPWEDWSARRRAHWRLRFEDLNSAARQREGDYKKLFLASRPPGHAQYPRLK